MTRQEEEVLRGALQKLAAADAFVQEVNLTNEEASLLHKWIRNEKWRHRRPEPRLPIGNPYD